MELKKKSLKIILAQPRGFCAGVERAIEIVERALKIYGPPVYVRHEIVHNKRVVNNLSSKGAVFVKELDQIPQGAVTVFSAHGVSQKVEDTAGVRKLPVLDATCPLVAKVHKEGQRYSKDGFEVILIGHEGHPEVEGTMGRIPGPVYLVSNTNDVKRLKVKNPDKLSYVSQTTLSVDDTRDVINALQERFPKIVGPDVKDICYATQNRQSAVRDLVKNVDLVLVVGARNSSNSNRLKDIGSESGVNTHLIETADDMSLSWFENVDSVGITSGASTPDELVKEVIDRISTFTSIEIEKQAGIEENVVFKLPKELLNYEMAN
ncbi:MAG: 4-hydroxy-3-methylbut-2-enyl diphosphate reductase [Rickettsiales bacterium]|nr:4-hydroxy-3-methylbut-2-enyl diphosphate reductase [Rickettsiales bacterium]RPG13420.1 MAG: 4-hydroxy-3-methylbut-2-enyl diphosphate reductase [Pelagibacteraceae bacterium TMED195]|tara:strand:+ start:4981 stop:5940 length:960 start_codon:yes stop_codon:yes gene_type:complete